MKLPQLKQINKLYFGYEDIANALAISPASARVAASRYERQGYIVRAKRNMYLLADRWESLEIEDMFSVANLIQTPSYVSLMTAMSYYELTTQAQQGFIESLAIRRTKEVEVRAVVFNYTKVNKDLYFGFSRRRGFFIASPEKAFVDALYLKSLGRYSFDVSSIDFSRFSAPRLNDIMNRFPKRVGLQYERLGKT